MYVHLTHPEIPTCTACQAYLFDDNWRVARRGSKPVPRPPGSPLPCWKCPKSREGKPNPAADFVGRTAAAYELYLAVQAGAPVPEDAEAVRVCVAVRRAVEAAQRNNPEAAQLLRLLFGGSSDG